MTGAGIMLMSDDVPSGTVAATDDVANEIEDLQYTLGEGPCVDAYHQDRPVAEADLASAPAGARWAAFASGAVAGGARAVFGFPLRVGAVRLGALNLYRSVPGPLTDEQHANALVVADVAAETLLAFQAATPPGQLSAELEANADFRFVVAQASGMVSVQLDVSVGQALVRLRAHAFSSGRPVNDVAAEVVGRRMRFDEGDRHPA